MIEIGIERGEGLEVVVWIEIRIGIEKGIEILDVDIVSKLFGLVDNMCWKVDGCIVGSFEFCLFLCYCCVKNRDEDCYYKLRLSRRWFWLGLRSDFSDYFSDSESEDERWRRKWKE